MTATGTAAPGQTNMALDSAHVSLHRVILPRFLVDGLLGQVITLNHGADRNVDCLVLTCVFSLRNGAALHF